MPSPFPGMNPYWEEPNIFRDLHNTFITYLRSAIRAGLPPNYVARVGERTWIETAGREIEPDVQVLHPTPQHDVRSRTSIPLVTVPVIVEVEHDEFVEPYLDILYVGDEGLRLVTSIEVLSPTNKRPGDRGQAKYLQKQTEILERDVPLVEIDLLRSGRHTTAVPEPALRRIAPVARYHVCIRDFTVVDRFTLYPIRLQDALPTIRIPLLPPDEGVVVELQPVLRQAEADGEFDRTTDYSVAPPSPSLSAAELTWVRERIAAAAAAHG